VLSCAGLDSHDRRGIRNRKVDRSKRRRACLNARADEARVGVLRRFAPTRYALQRKTRSVKSRTASLSQKPSKRIRMVRVIGDAQKQIDTHRPHERAAWPARLDRANAIAHAANRRRGNAEPEKTIAQDGSGAHRESTDHAT
jgi:hypothetical protein